MEPERREIENFWCLVVSTRPTQPKLIREQSSFWRLLGKGNKLRCGRQFFCAKLFSGEPNIPAIAKYKGLCSENCESKSKKRPRSTQRPDMA